MAVLQLGDHVTVRGRKGRVRYLGPTRFSDGEWAGIEFDAAIGRNVIPAHVAAAQLRAAVAPNPQREKCGGVCRERLVRKVSCHGADFSEL